ncbi:hypothetical protein BO70DRAFT_400712 [Aspergillus heteromorphus CBS 117.55]|uniref:Uncharacterized protein n=1 Tax=Aspergillus heteromorphus CBS 117.55 TaxID=1448321 RepID=A0A317UZE6_9EURO|nr:uncharacterized protein BO70DRAFT_400712 [Aspergillus heteromorphus CBS 117.55]PWY66729.1 hypothetical protein BO70DRAFT_400712 [Aspergillus heteromorphus CBS 117.55]
MKPKRPQYVPLDVWDLILKIMHAHEADTYREYARHRSYLEQDIQDKIYYIERELAICIKLVNSPVMEDDWARNSFEAFYQVIMKIDEMGRLGPGENFAHAPEAVILYGFLYLLKKAAVKCRVVGRNPKGYNGETEEEDDIDHPLHGVYLAGQSRARYTKEAVKAKARFQRLLDALIKWEYSGRDPYFRAMTV